MEHPFSLEVRTVEVTAVRLGDATGFNDGTLTVGVPEVSAMVLADPRIAAVAVALAEPGDDTRIVHCLDAVEPRAKVGPGAVFPGFVAGMATVGTGETVRLAGVAVIASSRYPQPFSGLLQAREAVVDMSGPSAGFSPFSRVRNLVLCFTPNPEVENADYDDAVRRATLRVAESLARTAGDAPGTTMRFDITTRHAGLPRVVYFYQLQGQGPMADTFLYGRDIHNLVPTLIQPGEVMDGAIVNGVYVYSCYKNPTYLHQNNPVIWDLMRRHGVDLDFTGIIINRGHNYTQDDKERSSRWVAKLAGMLGADGAVLTAEGGGNSAIDMMLACQYLEQAGVKTVVISSEATGADGYAFPLFYSVPEADAIVSVGSEDEIVAMPPVSRVIGDDTLLDGTPASGPFELKMYYQYCGTNQLGANLLMGRAF